MKCPHCGQWNQASFKRCLKCGEPLHTNEAIPPVGVKPPQWQNELKAGRQTYIHVDEDGNAEETRDAREALAESMADLKRRKVRGEEKQKELRREGSRKGYAPSKLNITRHTARTNFFTFDENETSRVKKLDQDNAAGMDMPMFDSLDDSGSLDVAQFSAQPYYPRPQDVNYKRITVHRMGLRRFLRVFLVLVAAAGLVFAGQLVYSEIGRRKAEKKEALKPIITASMQDDLAAHTIQIPGEEGAQIYIRELRLSYNVSGGYATVEVPDHVWYDDYQDYLQSTMTVTLTPSKKLAGGQQVPLDPISYDIEIPLSKIEMLSPDATRVEVSMAMYSIKFRVQENSTVYVNNENLSDMVNLEGGDVTYNATVQPIGDNVFTISVRSQHCRENTISVVLYRAEQEIPLDLASDTHTRSSSKSMLITATTLPGAIVNVTTPHTDLDITNIDATGNFTFYAVFDHIGYNTVTITADYPGKKQSVLNHMVYHVPLASDYTKVAWDVNKDYADLLANNALRVKQTRIYVCKGTIERIISEKPQLAVMNVGSAEQPRYVLLENNTRATWQLGTYYRVYGDAYGMYDDMPRLQARYTYLD